MLQVLQGVSRDGNMLSIEDVKTLARKVFIRSGGAGCFLWDRSERIAGNVSRICDFEELTKPRVDIDKFCLSAAAYFSETGRAGQISSDETTIVWPASVNADQWVLHECTEVVAGQLEGIARAEQITKINKIIVESWNNYTQLVEAMILSDARNLDDMGLSGAAGEFMRCFLQGKGFERVLRTWRNKIDYGYWQARVNEGLNFESSRQVAEKRLKKVQWLMEHFAAEHEAKDFEKQKTERFLVNQQRIGR